MNFIQSKKCICKDGSHLPIPLSAALSEFEETAKLIHAEVEETAKLLHQRFQAVNYTVPAHLVLQNLFHQLFACISQVMDVDTITVLLPTEDGQQLAVCATLGLEEEIVEGIQIPIGRGFAGRIAASCEPTIVDDLAKVEVVSPILRDKGIRSMLGVPLLVKDEVIGVFHIGTFRPRQFTEDDAQLLRFVADHIGVVLNCLQISRPFIAKNSVLIWEKFALNCSHQKASQTIKKFTFYSYLTDLLELASPFLRLTLTFC